MTGKYKAVVGNTQHPEGLKRCQVKVINLWDGIPEESLPWAEYQLPIGAGFVPAKTGDFVWVEFPYDGDSKFPLIVGAASVAPKGTPNTPPESSGKGKPFEQAKVDGAPTLPAVTPGADFVLRRNGLIEQRTANGGIMFTHEKSGSRFGLNDDGEFFIYSAKVMHFNSGGTIALETKAAYTVKSGSTIALESKSDYSIKSGGKWTLNATGDGTIKVASFTLTASKVAVKQG